jgi:hypothetical protein
MSERKLKGWLEAGLIDTETAARIRAHEAATARPFGLWALIGLGALAIGLGLISVVAANWDEIPGMLRLGVHFALLTGLAGLFWWQMSLNPRWNDMAHDALLFILAALGLTFFGHIGQVYQTSSPLWQPLALWLLLFTPLLLGHGRSWLVASLWMAGVIVTCWTHADYMTGYWRGVSDRSPGSQSLPALYWAAITAPPIIAAPVAAWLRGKTTRPNFWRRIEQLALFAILVWVSGTLIYFAVDMRHDRSWAIESLMRSALLACAAAGVWFARPTHSGRATAAIIGTAAFTNMFGPLVTGSSLVEGMLFMALWAAIAGAAHYAAWRVIFQIAVGVLALRLISLSFELASDLLGSGIGLILAGIATLGIAWMAVRVSRRFAPAKEELA